MTTNYTRESPSSQPILEVAGLTKTYYSAGRPLTVLHEVSFSLPAGDTCAIVGPSGSGKTTLLGLCAGLDRATSGTIRLDGVSLHDLGEEERAALRNRLIGFVFQSFQLIPTLTALENVMVPAEIAGGGPDKARKRAEELLARVGLEQRAGHRPSQLSGGEQQRVALARAFINAPRILFADEPMGNLDAENAALVERLLFELNRETGATLVIVTHDMELAARAGRTIRLRNGRLSGTPGRE